MLRRSFNGTPILTNPFRNDRYAQHFGEDYALGHRAAIIAKADGVVIAAKGDEKRQWLANTNSDPFKPVGFPLVKRKLTTADYGNYIKIDHGKNTSGKTVSTLVAHLDEVLVYVGQRVGEGELIGYSDSKGNSTGNHIHEELRINDVVIDPNNFDYSFKGLGGGVKEVVIHELQDKITITSGLLYVRAGPAKVYPQSGSKILRKGDIVDVIGFTEGEDVSGNKLWYKSKLGNFFWAGGTNKPEPKLPEVDNIKKDMTQEEHEAKLKELEEKAARIEARRVELEEATKLNVADQEAYKAEWEAFAAVAVEPVAETPESATEAVDTVAEEVVVEVPAEELTPVEDEQKSAFQSFVSKFEQELQELKARFGL